MKKILFSLITLLSIALIACGGSKETVKDTKKPAVDDNPPIVAAGGHNMWVDQSNKQLAKIPVEGFGYKKSNVPAQKWDKWAKLSAPVIKKILDNMPAGYVLQVTGHTDARGPEEPEGAKPGNIKLSNDRAKEVHDALRRQGISSPKMTYKGIGSSDPLSGINPKSPQQRRVTFKVIPE